MWSLNYATFGLLAGLASASLQIVPGATWTATNSPAHIQAHGGGIIKVGAKWYWIGEDKTNGTAFININCYSSSDLAQWSYEGALLSQTGTTGDLGPGRVIERPKVIYNAKTNKYILWMHIDSSTYSEAKIGVATGDTVCGKYTYLGSQKPLGFESRDSGTYVDDDGKGYLLTEDRANGLRINRLTDDYTNVSSATYLFAEKYESPALIKKNGVYFMFASQLTGWAPNDNYYSTATNISGPWSAWNLFAAANTKTYASQTNFVLPVGDGFVFMGDRWVAPPNLVRSTYIWLPLKISGTTASVSSYVNWILNSSTGASTTITTENTYEGESATLAGGAKNVTCSTCSGGVSAGYIGGTSGGTATFSNIYSSVATTTTIRIKYTNGDSAQRIANVTVNGAMSQTVAFIQNGTVLSSSVVHVKLNAGNNVVRFAGVNGAYAPNVDQLIVPSS